VLSSSWFGEYCRTEACLALPIMVGVGDDDDDDDVGAALDLNLSPGNIPLDETAQPR
jgi:hypothetical protein